MAAADRRPRGSKALGFSPICPAFSPTKPNQANKKKPLAFPREILSKCSLNNSSKAPEWNERSVWIFNMIKSFLYANTERAGELCQSNQEEGSFLPGNYLSEYQPMGNDLKHSFSIGFSKHPYTSKKIKPACSSQNTWTRNIFRAFISIIWLLSVSPDGPQINCHS